MQKRGQTAVEFLTTYGWAIMIIVIVVAVLAGIGVFNQQNIKQSCIASYPINCVDVYVDKKGTVELTFSANDVESATLERVTLTSTVGVGCPPFNSDSSQIIAEDTGLRTCISNQNLKPGSVYEGIAEISYKLKGGSEEHISKVKFVGNVEDSCRENWQYSEWGVCDQNTKKQTRTATDTNNCGTISKKQPLERDCCTGTPFCNPNGKKDAFGNIIEYCEINPNEQELEKYQWHECIEGLICSESERMCVSGTGDPTVCQQLPQCCTNGVKDYGWQCGSWGSCINGKQTRMCTTTCPLCGQGDETPLCPSNQQEQSQSCGGDSKICESKIFKTNSCPGGYGCKVHCFDSRPEISSECGIRCIETAY